MPSNNYDDLELRKKHVEELLASDGYKFMLNFYKKSSKEDGKAEIIQKLTEKHMSDTIISELLDMSLEDVWAYQKRKY